MSFRRFCQIFGTFFAPTRAMVHFLDFDPPPRRGHATPMRGWKGRLVGINQYSVNPDSDVVATDLEQGQQLPQLLQLQLRCPCSMRSLDHATGRRIISSRYVLTDCARRFFTPLSIVRTHTVAWVSGDRQIECTAIN